MMLSLLFSLFCFEPQSVHGTFVGPDRDPDAPGPDDAVFLMFATDVEDRIPGEVIVVLREADAPVWTWPALRADQLCMGVVDVDDGRILVCTGRQLGDGLPG